MEPINMVKIENKKKFMLGSKRGIPIAIGYIPVSFTFGLMAVSGGLPIWLTIVISITNLTSAGQFAGTKLILLGAGYFEIMLTTLVINIRYMLMSLSLSQKVEQSISLKKRFVFAFGITDETFSVASMESGKLSFSYMMGLICWPILGWTFGTAMGAFICSTLPRSIANAMGIALYGMFIAIIIPPARKSKAIVIVVILSIMITCILRYLTFLSFISSGFRVIIATILSAGIGALLFPVNHEDNSAKQEEAKV